MKIRYSKWFRRLCRHRNRVPMQGGYERCKLCGIPVLTDHPQARFISGNHG